MSVNRPGQAKSKSATQINRELREQIKSSPKVVGQKKTDTGKKEIKSTDKKPSLFKRVMTKKIFPTKKQEEKRAKLKETFGRKTNKTTSSYNKKADPSAISYRKGGGNAFVARQYGGKIGN